MQKLNFMCYLNILILINCLCFTKAWNNDELEIFDLVEEINENFYKLLGLSEDASVLDIKRAFRNLSIILHPDKNDAADANIKFRNLVSVYEVLKDQNKREKYNQILKEGLPNWKSALYYYRRVRKMGLTEGSIIVFIIISIGQYFFAWAAYLEKKYTAEQIIGSKLKKLQKKNKSNIDIDTIFGEIPTPSVLNTLPFQIIKAVWYSPSIMKAAIKSAYNYQQRENERKRMQSEEEAERRMAEEELIKEREAKKEMRENIRKRQKATSIPDKTADDLVGYSQIATTLSKKNISLSDNCKQLNGGIWTDDDLAELVYLVKKHPPGTLNRWDIISKNMNRSVSEITFMSTKLREVAFNPASKETCLKATTSEAKLNNSKKDNILVPQKNWSQEQQRALENAITKYKSSNIDRWQKISNNVPGKTKEECLQRYKYLVELVKLQKQKQNPVVEDDNPNLIEKSNDSEILQNVDNCSEDEDIQEPLSKSRSGGKPKNKRKERKKQFNFSSDDDSSNTENSD